MGKRQEEVEEKYHKWRLFVADKETFSSAKNSFSTTALETLLTSLFASRVMHRKDLVNLLGNFFTSLLQQLLLKLLIQQPLAAARRQLFSASAALLLVTARASARTLQFRVWLHTI